MIGFDLSGGVNDWFGPKWICSKKASKIKNN